MITVLQHAVLRSDIASMNLSKIICRIHERKKAAVAVSKCEFVELLFETGRCTKNSANFL